MIKAIVIDNGIVGLRDCFRSGAKVRYTFWEVGKPDQPDWLDFDLLVVPNGSDQVAMLYPIVEHGVQQITHLDHYVDRLTHWLCGQRPSGPFAIRSSDYGVSNL